LLRQLIPEFHLVPDEWKPKVIGKARLHERLAELSKTWSQAPGMEGVTLDCFIISATSYDLLCQYYSEGNWTRHDFAERHILFPDDASEGGYCQHLFGRSSLVAAHA
jgi:hypothetical protein